MEHAVISDSTYAVISSFLSKCRPGVRNLVLSTLSAVMSKTSIEGVSGRLIELGLSWIADDGESSRAIASPAWLAGEFAPDFVAFVAILPQFMGLSPQAKVHTQRRLSMLNSTVETPPAGAKEHFVLRTQDCPFWEFYNEASVVEAVIRELDFAERRQAISYLASRETRGAEELAHVIRDFVGCQIASPAGPYRRWSLDRELWLHPSLHAFLEAVDFIAALPTPQLRFVVSRAQQDLNRQPPAGPWVPLVRLSSDIERSGDQLPLSEGGHPDPSVPYDGPLTPRVREDVMGGDQPEAKQDVPRRTVEEAKIPESGGGFSHPILRTLGATPHSPDVALDLLSSAANWTPEQVERIRAFAPNGVWLQTVYVIDDGLALPGVAWANVSNVTSRGGIHMWVPPGAINVHIAFERVDLLSGGQRSEP